MLRFYFDESVSEEVAKAARKADVDVVTTEQDGSRGKPDPAILNRSGELGRVLVTCDVDHVVLAANILATGNTPPHIIFFRQNTLTVGQVVADLALVAAAATTQDFDAGVMRLPLR